jgi:hypothetical protein
MQKYEEREQQQDSPEMRQLINRCRNVPFYYWGRNSHKTADPINCICFNHILGLPEKHGKKYPLFDYEHMVFRALTEPGFINTRQANSKDEKIFRQLEIEAELKTKSKNESVTNAYNDYLKEKANTLIYPQKVGHVAVLKSTGLGLTEWTLRYIAWNCLKDNKWKSRDVVILTGIRQELATDAITRLRNLFLPLGITFDTRNTTIWFNGVRIRAFPTDQHLNAIRGLADPALLYCDEASFFGGKTDDVISVLERYAGKSNAQIILTSTPNKPNDDDIMYRITNQPYSESFYKVLKFDYTWGLDKIYTKEDIEIAKASSSFEQEYNLKFAGISGNLMQETALNRCIELGKRMDETAPIDNWDIETDYVLSVDIGWGSSATAITISRFVNGKVQIIYSKEFERRTVFQDIVNEIWRLKSKCGNKLKNIIIDASATELYTTLCTEFKQNPSLKYLQDKQKMVKDYNTYLGKYCFIVPVAFGSTTQGGRTMLNHTQRMIEETEDDGSALLAIHPSFQDLIDSCRSAYTSGNDKLDKDRTVHNDSFDSLLLNLSYYRWN